MDPSVCWSSAVDLRCSETLSDVEPNNAASRVNATPSPMLKTIVLPASAKMQPVSKSQTGAVRLLYNSQTVAVVSQKQAIVTPLAQPPRMAPSINVQPPRVAPSINVQPPRVAPSINANAKTVQTFPKFRPTGSPVPVTQRSMPAFVPISTISTQASRQPSIRPLPNFGLSSNVYPSPQSRPPPPGINPHFGQTTKSPSAPPAPVTPNRESTPGTPGQSPRPSILRKRHSEMTREGASPSTPIAARKLVYEPTNLSLGMNRTMREGDTLGDSEREVKEEREESPSEDRSNQSIASTGSTLSASGSTAASSQNEAEISPRKRPRKQAFAEGKTTDDAVHYTRITDENATVNDQQLKLSMKRMDVTPEVFEAPDECKPSTPDTMVEEEEERTMTPPTDDALSDGEADVILPMTHSPSISPPPLASQRKLLNKCLDSVKEEVKEEGCRPLFRPRPSLLSGFKLKYYPRKNHFRKPEMVKCKDVMNGGSRRKELLDSKRIQKNNAVVKLANDDETWKKLSDMYKLDRVVMQLDDIASYEDDNALALCAVAKNIAQSDKLDSPDRLLLEEMALTSGQRNKAMIDMVEEIKGDIGSIKEHADKGKSLLNKYTSKRHMRARKGHFKH